MADTVYAARVRWDAAKIAVGWCVDVRRKEAEALQSVSSDNRALQQALQQHRVGMKTIC